MEPRQEKAGGGVAAAGTEQVAPQRALGDEPDAATPAPAAIATIAGAPVAVLWSAVCHLPTT